MQALVNALTAFVLFMSAVTLWGTLRRPTRYGRYMRDGQARTLPALPGWLLFESPQLLAFALTFWCAAGPRTGVAVLFFGLWQAHYIYRAVIFPLRMRSRHKRFPIGGVVAGVVFNTINGVINGWAVAHAPHLAGAAWATDPRFLAGVSVMAVGWLVNVYADNVLVSLRADGFTGYRIPCGGPYRWVSAPNYLGEIVLWCGFALATWTLPGLAFALFTISNLAPRALSHHRWYREHFPDYPPERKALVPFLL